MIEELDIIKHTENIVDRDGYTVNVVYGGAINKINEIIEIVNALVKENNIHEEQIDELQMKLEPEKCKTPADPFAKQRKWIGCVCRFWYDDPDDTVLDYLGKIQTGENGIEYYGKETYDWFPHCEPVKPDDDIIYKGE